MSSNLDAWGGGATSDPIGWHLYGLGWRRCVKSRHWCIRAQPAAASKQWVLDPNVSPLNIGLSCFTESWYMKECIA